MPISCGMELLGFTFSNFYHQLTTRVPVNRGATFSPSSAVHPRSRSLDALLQLNECWNTHGLVNRLWAPLLGRTLISSLINIDVRALLIDLFAYVPNLSHSGPRSSEIAGLQVYDYFQRESIRDEARAITSGLARKRHLAGNKLKLPTTSGVGTAEAN